MKTFIKVFLIFLAVYILFMGGHLYSPDEEIVFRTTEAICERGTLAIEPLLGFASKQGADGREYGQYGIGQSLAAIPFYWTGKALAAMAADGPAPRWIAGQTQYHEMTMRSTRLRLGVSLFNQVTTALLCAVFFTFVLKVSGDRRSAWVSTVLLGLGTYVLPHSRTFFSEPLAALCAFGAFSLLYYGLERRGTSFIVLAGAVFAFGLLVRLDSLFFIPGYLAMIFLMNARGTEGGIRGALVAQYKSPEAARGYLFFLPLAAAFFIIFAMNYSRFGSLFSTGYEDQSEGLRFTTPLHEGLYGYLFSVGRGLFFFSPPLAAALFGWKKFHRRHPQLSTAAAVLILSFFIVQCKWQNWAGGWCWGPRHIYQIHVFLSIPLVFVFEGQWTRMKRAALAMVLGAGLFVQILGSSVNFIDYYRDFFTTPRQEPNNPMMWYRESAPFLDSAYALYILDEEGRPLRRVPLEVLVAPIQNSLYIPQHSAWSGYPVMLQLGRHDFFWLRLLSKSGRQ
ncbi:MAG TPA: hypothetical protein PLB62_08335 [Candidatus Sumerlaeota bacterium]|nr:hypothetical protein [Candidatus Sumerlaeota bacterium]